MKSRPRLPVETHEDSTKQPLVRLTLSESSRKTLPNRCHDMTSPSKTGAEQSHILHPFTGCKGWHSSIFISVCVCLSATASCRYHGDHIRLMLKNVMVAHFTSSFRMIFQFMSIFGGALYAAALVEASTSKIAHYLGILRTGHRLIAAR